VTQALVPFGRRLHARLELSALAYVLGVRPDIEADLDGTAVTWNGAVGLGWSF
jgi:hypothetical protein